MSGSSRDDRGANRATGGSHQSVMRALADMMPWQMARNVRQLQAENQSILERSDRIEHRLDSIEGRLDALGDAIGAQSERHDRSEATMKTLQDHLESINTVRMVAVDARIDQVEVSLADIASEATRLRDGVIPAAEGRWNVLFERLAFELEETASLVERILKSEPLPVIEPGPTERLLAEGLSKVQSLLVEEFRGSEDEISHRLESVLPLVGGHAPVLDLGCGRGELLLLLREAGIEARGVESDVAMVQGATRRGLMVDHADVLDALRDCDDASVGSVTAFHLFEHLSGVLLSEVLNQCRRILRPGGVLLAECPNPHNIRVGASLFWQDPTHVRPLLPETLALFLKASGLSVESIDFLHPFPAEQHFRSVDDSSSEPQEDLRIGRLEEGLDRLLHGPRDFRVVAVKPQIEVSSGRKE